VAAVAEARVKPRMNNKIKKKGYVTFKKITPGPSSGEVLGGLSDVFLGPSFFNKWSPPSEKYWSHSTQKSSKRLVYN